MLIVVNHPLNFIFYAMYCDLKKIKTIKDLTKINKNEKVKYTKKIINILF